MITRNFRLAFFPILLDFPFELYQFFNVLYFLFLLYALCLFFLSPSSLCSISYISFFLFETQPHFYLGLEPAIC